MEARANPRIRALLLGMTAALLGACLTWTPWGLALEERFGLPLLFEWRGARQPPSEILIVGIDGQEAQRVGWPARVDQWPRSRHAEMIRRLRSGCARIIAYDVFFAAPRDAEQDAALASAIREAGNVILVSRLGLAPLPPGSSLPIMSLQVHQPPMDAFAEAAAGYAPFALPSGRPVTGTWLFKRDAGDQPSLPVTAYRAYQRSALESHREKPYPAPPSSAQPDQYLDFYGPPRTIKTVDFSDVLAGPQDRFRCQNGLFAGKAVFIGMSETSPVEQKDRDVFDTVFTDADGRRLSGVEIAATSFANLLEARSLRRPDHRIELLGLVSWGLAAAWLWNCLSPPVALGLFLVAAAGYGWLGGTVFAASGLWLPLLIPALQLLLAGAGGIALQRSDLASRLHRLRHALSSWLPESAVAEIMADPQVRRRASGRVYGSCLSIDLDFTTRESARYDIVALNREAAERMHRLHQAILRGQGSLGDETRHSMLGYWVAAKPRHTLRQAAGDALQNITAILEEPWPLAAPAFRIGLHAGPFAIEDTRGSSQRGFGVVIDAAEHIARLNDALGTRALASRDAVAGISGFQFRPVGSFLFPHHIHPLELVEFPAPASADQTGWLRTAFDDALSAYRQGLLADCADELQAILKRFPHDGPSRYYLRRCEFFRHQPTAGVWDPVVRL